MRRPFRSGGQALPKRTERTLREAQDRLTIARMLDAGAVETPIGPETHLRLASGGYAKFASVLVEDVKRTRRQAREDLGDG